MRKLEMLLISIFGPVVLSVLVNGPAIYLASQQVHEINASVGPEKRMTISGFDGEYPDCQVALLHESKSSSLLVMSQGNRSVLVSVLQDKLENLTFTRKSVLLSPFQTTSHGLKSWYVGICSVVTMPNGDLWAFYQEEYRPNQSASDTYAAQIGYAVAKKGTTNFINHGTLLQSAVMWDREGRSISGIGQPNAVVKDDFLYIFFTNWDAHYDSIHLARAPLSDIHAWSVWSGSDPAFVPIADGVIPVDESRTVISSSSVDGSAVYTALAGISYNVLAHGYVATYETACGFRYKESNDLTNWGVEHMLVNFSVCKLGANTREFRSYPMLFSLNAEDGVTTDSATLAYACKLGGDKSHMLCLRQVQFVVP